MERVVVTGMGVVSPLGINVNDYWAGLLAGVPGVVALTDAAYARLRSRIGALLCGYDERVQFDPREARRMSRSSKMAVVAAAQAVAQANFNDFRVNPYEVGVIIGSSIGGFAHSDASYKAFYSGRTSGPLVIPLSMNSAPASNVSIRYGFRGPLMTVDAACASGAHSIGYCYNLIRAGLLEVAVTGGSDSPFSPAVVSAWCDLQALSVRNDEPARACRPFSADRDGLVLGEGAGILIVESETSARRRGATILGEILGYGASSDSHHLTQPMPEGPAVAMRRALADARLAPDEIDWINAHGTGTAWNDRTETAAIKDVFGLHAATLPVVSSKGAIGHAIGASAALQAVTALLSLKAQKVPPTINYAIPDPECDLDYVTDGPRPWQVRRVMCNSFAFGGSNAALILGHYVPQGH
jgi:3-oxoacyl-[acyl-carrier-protein] synthase II